MSNMVYQWSVCGGDFGRFSCEMRGERWMLERVRTGGRVARWPTPATCLPAESSQARARGTVKGGRTQVVTSQTWG